MSDTPIHDQMKAEAVSEFTKGIGVAFQSIIDAFKPFVDSIMAVVKAMQRYDMSSGQPVRNPGMKPLLGNGRKPR